MVILQFFKDIDVTLYSCREKKSSITVHRPKTYLHVTRVGLVLDDNPLKTTQLPVSHPHFVPATRSGTASHACVCAVLATGTHNNPRSTIPLNLWPQLIVTCEQHCGKHVVQVLHSPASCLCSASMEGRGGGNEERELFNPPQRNSPLNPYRELAGKSRCWKAHHTHKLLSF